MWDDLAYFAAVARAGSLGGAAQALGVSQATLSRRMTALEHTLGKRLFQRGASGYAVTAEGRDLQSHCHRMETVAADIDAWCRADTPQRRVRISAGTWGAAMLAHHLPQVWSPDAPWVPEFVASEARLDIARREIDIGLRNRRPDQPWLAGQKLRNVQYAAFGTSTSVTGWIGGTGARAANPSVRWTEQHHAADVITRANDTRLAVALAQAGVGRIVLPVFAAPLAPGLVQLSPPLPDLTTEEWLVSHHDERHAPPIRAALQAICGIVATVQRQITSDPAT